MEAKTLACMAASFIVGLVLSLIIIATTQVSINPVLLVITCLIAAIPVGAMVKKFCFS